MNNTDDFRKGKRGAVLPEPPLETGKVKTSIRLDDDVLKHFFEMADQNGSGYQTLLDSALREYLDGKAAKVEDALRQIVREEMARSNKVASHKQGIGNIPPSQRRLVDRHVVR